jgi:hypothetical protein
MKSLQEKLEKYDIFLEKVKNRKIKTLVFNGEDRMIIFISAWLVRAAGYTSREPVKPSRCCRRTII